MLGFTLNLNRELTADSYNYLIAMRNAGFTTIYVSLRQPQAETQKRLQDLVKWSNNLDLKIFAAVSSASLKKLGVDLNDVGQVQALGLNGLKVGPDLDYQTVAKLTKSLPVAVDAARLNNDQLADLREYNANLTNLIAGYNFYPQPETGIDAHWFQQKNAWLRRQELTIAAFIPGDQHQAATLEREREQHPLAALLAMQKYGCDQIFIGDTDLKSTTIAAFTNYLKEKAITLRLEEPVAALTAQAWRNLPYVARDLIRLQADKEGADLALQPSQTVARPAGSVTLVNEKGALAGEIDITRRDLPAKAQINVLTHIVPADLSLLPLIGPSARIVLTAQK